MASLAQYSAALHDAPEARTPSTGSLGSRLFGAALALSTVALVLAAAIQSA
jgi:hypothetical protein